MLGEVNEPDGQREILVVDGEGLLTGYAWSISELLRGDLKASQYGQVILPLTVLRRLDCQHDLGVFRPESLSDWQMANHLRRGAERLSPETAYMFECFGLDRTLSHLEQVGLLGHVVARFGELDLSTESVSNEQMGAAFDDLIRRHERESAEVAGEHSTPADVSALLVSLLVMSGNQTPSIQTSQPIRLYDPACGTGGTLTALSKRLREGKSSAELTISGQELNAESYAISQARLLMYGIVAAVIARGDSLSNDRHPGEVFEYLVSQPPFGLNWSRARDQVMHEAEVLSFGGRFGAGLPWINDSSLLFVQHMIAHMKPADQGGSRIAIVLNGSPMFHGAAGSGESEIRRWILQNDLLEGIVALPEKLFSHTSIATYIWLLSNRKPSATKGKVIFLDARPYGAKARVSAGYKHKYLTNQQITEITALYAAAAGSSDGQVESDKGSAQLISSTDFGYQQVVVERPLRLRFSVTPTAITQMKARRTLQAFQEADVLVSVVARMEGRTWTAKADFEADLMSDLQAAGAEPLPRRVQTIVVDAVSVPDQAGEIQRNRRGEVLPDPDLRLRYKLPLGKNVANFVQREVIPEYPDARVNLSAVRVGYEVPQTLLFADQWGEGFGALAKVARRIPARSVSDEARNNMPLLTGRDLFSTTTAADLPDASDSKTPLLALCTGGDVVGLGTRWRMLPAEFGEGLTTLDVLRPLSGGGRTLCEWLNSGRNRQPGPRPYVSMDMPVPVDMIKDSGFDALLDELEARRADLADTMPIITPNMFHESQTNMENFRRVAQAALSKAQLVGDLMRPLGDPIWRAEMSYPFHIAGLARQYRLAVSASDRKDALLKLGESIARTVGIVSLAILIRRRGGFIRALRNDFSRGGGATFGTWTKTIKSLLDEGAIPELPELASAGEPDGTCDLLLGILDARNRFGHAFGVRAPHELEQDVQGLEPLVIAAMESVTWLSNLAWDLVEQCTYTGNGFRLLGKRLRGSHPDWEPIDRLRAEALAPGRIYAQSPSSAEPVILGPVAQVAICPTCRNRELFLLNLLKDGTMTLRSGNDHETSCSLP